MAIRDAGLSDRVLGARRVLALDTAVRFVRRTVERAFCIVDPERDHRVSHA
jgi:hypothetical protein